MSGSPSQSLASLGVLLAGLLGGIGLIATSPSLETDVPIEQPPLLRVEALASETLQLEVVAHGTVEPRTEIELVSEVTGRVTEVSPGLATGAFFEAGDVLLRVDAKDYELALEQAETRRARTEVEAELASQRLARQERLASSGVASAAALDDARAAARVSEAALREADASLTQARRELERTEIVAPFAGRVREQRVDEGQFVSRGHAVAKVYAVDFAELRLPILDRDAALLDLPVAYRSAHRSGQGDDPTAKDARAPEVELRGTFLGNEHTWHGQIVRTEGEIDPDTRMIHAIARIEDPYARRGDGDSPPLAVGLFVEARILGRRVEDVMRVPRIALRGQNHVAVVDRDDRLRLREVEVVQRQRTHIVVRSGLEAGDRICVSPLERVIDGARVRIAEASSGESGDNGNGRS